MNEVAAGRRQRWIDEIRIMAPKLASTLGTTGCISALGLVTGTLAARVLGPSHRGELAELLLWPQLIVTLGNFGIELSAVFLSGDPARRRNVPATLLTLALSLSALLMLVYVCAIPFVFGSAAMSREALLLTPLIPMYLVGAVSIDCLAGRLRFGAFNAVRMTLPAVYFASIISLAAAGVLSPISAALVFVTANIAADVLALVLVWRDGGLGKFDGKLARDAMHFGARAHFGRLWPQSLGIDMAIIALLLTSHDVGLYSVATAFLALPGLFASSLGMVLFPQVSASHQAGERPQLQATFALHVAVMIAISAGLVVFARPAVTLLFGASYAGAAMPLRLLAVGSVAVSVRSFPVEVLRGIGRPGLTSVAEAANWVLFLLAVPVGATAGGLSGAAAGMAAASYGSLAVLGLLIWRGDVFGVRPEQPFLSEAMEAA
jgi:O-antigen/teichoic acid export membrane protein